MYVLLLCPRHLAHVMSTYISLKNKWNEGSQKTEVWLERKEEKKNGNGDFKMWSMAPSASWRSNRVIRTRAPTGFSIRILTKATSVAQLDQKQNYGKISTNKHYLHSQRKQNLSETQKANGKICLRLKYISFMRQVERGQ